MSYLEDRFRRTTLGSLMQGDTYKDSFKHGNQKAFDPTGKLIYKDQVTADVPGSKNMSEAAYMDYKEKLKKKKKKKKVMGLKHGGRVKCGVGGYYRGKR